MRAKLLLVLGQDQQDTRQATLNKNFQPCLPRCCFMPCKCWSSSVAAQCGDNKVQVWRFVHHVLQLVRRARHFNVPLTTLPVNVGLAISVLITAAASFTPPRGCPKYVVTQAKCKPARTWGRSSATLPLNGPRLCRRIGASSPAASAVLR